MNIDVSIRDQFKIHNVNSITLGYSAMLVVLILA